MSKTLFELITGLPKVAFLNMDFTNPFNQKEGLVAISQSYPIRKVELVDLGRLHEEDSLRRAYLRNNLAPALQYQ